MTKPEAHIFRYFHRSWPPPSSRIVRILIKSRLLPGYPGVLRFRTLMGRALQGARVKCSFLYFLRFSFFSFLIVCCSYVYRETFSQARSDPCPSSKAKQF